MPVQWQTAHIPLAAGVDTQKDPRALEPPALSRCRDGEFTELGGIQTRKPYEAMSTDIVGGGQLSDVRRLATYGDDLLCFTSGHIYAWSEPDGAWADRGEHVAAAVTERTMLDSPAEQVTGDRAEVGGVVIHAWHETGGSSRVAISDAESGSLLRGPWGIEGRHPGVVPISGAALVFSVEEASLGDSELFVTTVSAGQSSAPTTTDSAVISNGSVYAFDAVDISASEAIVAAVATTGYYIARVTESGIQDSDTISRDPHGAIAVSRQAGDDVFVARAGDAGSIFVDPVDVDTLSAGTEIEVFDGDGVSDTTPVNNIATSLDGVSGLVVLWTANQDEGAAVHGVRSGSVDISAGTASGGDYIAWNVSIASGGFRRDGSVYVWTVFAGESQVAGMEPSDDVTGQLQNTYFLYRSDGLLVAKATSLNAAGFPAQRGRLPHVQALGDDSFAWCGGFRGVIEVGDNQGGYAQKGLRDISLDFDSDDARRTAQIGRTLYVSGGQVMQYDGTGLTEVGFHLGPWLFINVILSGDIPAAIHVYKVTWRWDNAVGEIDRSTTSSSEVVDHGDDSSVDLGMAPLAQTRKQGDRDNVAAEVWRTEADPGEGAAFHLASSKDPADDSSDNHYVENAPFDAMTFHDNMIDEDLRAREVDHEAGGVLAHLAPPGASIVVAGTERLYLGGVSHDPYAVWYSRLRSEGEVASFNDLLRVTLPAEYGAVVAVELLQGSLVAFQERAIHLLGGDGLDNLGQGQNLGPPQRISGDVGAVSQDAMGVTPEGVVFHSLKGWYLLDRGFSLRYFGGPVQDFDDDTFVSVDVLTTEHQIRCLSREGRMLVYDWIAQQWSEWTIGDGLDSVSWRGRHVYLSTSGPMLQREDWQGIDYGLDIETAWIKFAGLSGLKRVRRLLPLGEVRSEHDLRLRVAYDYAEGDYQDDRARLQDGAAGSPLRFRHRCSKQKTSAVKVRLTAQAAGSESAPSGEAVKLTGLSVEYGQKSGLARLPQDS